jgi:hypothetical protein
MRSQGLNSKFTKLRLMSAPGPLQPSKAGGRSKRYATDPDLAWRALVTFVIGMALLAAGFFR